jgi:hypothetical protein
MEIFCPDLVKLQEIIDHVGITDDNVVFAKKPLLEGIKDFKVRCLLAVGIGCDVYISGVPGITPKNLLDYVRTLKNTNVNEDEYYCKILEFHLKHYRAQLLKKSGAVDTETASNNIESYKTMINVFVDSLMYEPINENYFESNGNLLEKSDANKYINDKYVPTAVHHYIKSFARNDPSIRILPPLTQTVFDIAICAGPGSGTHIFMSSEESNTCKECNLVTCKTCTFTEADENYCVNCFAATQFVDMGLIDLDKSQQEMVALLNAHGYQIAMTDKLEDIVDMYNYVLQKTMEDYLMRVLWNL